MKKTYALLIEMDEKDARDLCQLSLERILNNAENLADFVLHHPTAPSGLKEDANTYLQDHADYKFLWVNLTNSVRNSVHEEMRREASSDD